MEGSENENENSREFSSIPVKTKTFSHADSLFSTILTLYILILLYFPHIFFKIVFSPVLFITLILLLTLLRIGATQGEETKANKGGNCSNTEADHAIFDCNLHHQDHIWVTCTETSFNPDPSFEDSFVEWNVRAPLEVIYEAYEGEGEDQEENKDPNNKEKDPNRKDPSMTVIDRYPSLSFYYPESDSDSSSDGDFLAIGEWGSPESVSYRWEDDEDREGLIEIALDGVNDNNNKKRESDFDVGNFHGEEETNLIEIDISAVKNDEK